MLTCLSVLFNLKHSSLNHFLTLTSSTKQYMYILTVKNTYLQKGWALKKCLLRIYYEAINCKTKRNYCHAPPRWQWEIWMKTRFLSIYFHSALKQVTGGWILFDQQFGKGVVEESEIRMGGRRGGTYMLTVYMDNNFFFLFKMSVSIYLLLQILGWGR